MKSIIEEVMEPLEIVWKKLVSLSKEAYDFPVNSNSVYAIAQELDAVLTFTRRNLESFYSNEEDDEEEVCGNCGGKGSVAVPDGEWEIAYEPCPCSDTRNTSSLRNTQLSFEEF